ncbi:helicase [Oryctes borbonicus]|uniref:Helicase n=1 Tax=Oryctes borbonicus TaxID=1629725 RepID=A0A0T6BDZ0_9SCAR|nr:helicase [Oryctes borbonicus]
MTSIFAHNFDDKPRTKDVLIEEDLQFNALLLSQSTLTGLSNAGYRVPSPIQLKAIPIGKCGFDLIVKSKSGTGKTAVFSIITLELVNVNKNAVQVLMLAPTREIVVQIEAVLKSLGAPVEGLFIHSFIGGLPIEQDIKNLQKCHIAVGAPGRIRHLIELGALKTNAIRLFVLDEADKLVSSDMRSDVDYISNKLPIEKQVIASSATYSDDVHTYLSNVMSAPTFVEPNTDTPLLLGLKQFVSLVKGNMNVLHQLNMKNEELVRLLSHVTFSQCLVFTNYQGRAESISNTLNRKGWNSMHISGIQSQSERLKVMSSFREGKCRILLSTDLSARGIDAANVDLVINYDVPLEPSTYLHRMGRAGRFGSHGVCVTIAANAKELEDYRVILGNIGGTEMFVPQLPADENLPSDLWSADTKSFELIQGMLRSGSESTNRNEIVNSIVDWKMRVTSRNQTNTKINKETVKDRVDNSSIDENIKETSSQMPSNEDKTEMSIQNFNSHSSADIETLLELNKVKEENLKTNISKQYALSLLEGLASGKEISNLETVSQNTSPKQEALENILLDTLQSKKRKRDHGSGTSEPKVKLEESRRLDQTKYKNVALLNATKLICESYSADKISEDITSNLDPYFKAEIEDTYKQSSALNTTEDVLNSIASGKIENIFRDIVLEDKEIQEIDEVPDLALNEQPYNKDLEDIFKSSYDYAINSEKTHWLGALEDELIEEMSLTDQIVDTPGETLPEESCDFSFEVPKRKKHKSKKKKTFKDFTQKSKADPNDQTMESYNAQEETEIDNKVEPSDYYHSGLYSDYEYSSNEHFAMCFNQYSDELEQKLQTFDDIESFNKWFADWQWQVQGVRDYIQQNIYLQEMNKYAYGKNS